MQICANNGYIYRHVLINNIGFFSLTILELKTKYSFKEREYMDHSNSTNWRENCVNYICIKDSNFNVQYFTICIHLIYQCHYIVDRILNYVVGICWLIKRLKNKGFFITYICICQNQKFLNMLFWFFVFKHLWQLFFASLAYACKKIIIRQLMNEWFIIRNYKLNLHKLKSNAG